MPQQIILLMGALTYRADAFRDAAARLGLSVVSAIDMPQALAESWHYPLGIPFDKPDIAARGLVDYAASHPVQAILAVDDSGSLLAARAGEVLGLPHNAPRAAQAARNKYEMRRAFAEAGVPSPPFRRIDLAEDPEALAGRFEYPVVIKPLLLSGSRGVIRANTPAEFVGAFARTAEIVRTAAGGSAAGQSLLVESYIPGLEVALEGILFEGQLKVLAIFDKPDPLEGPFFEETIYVTPSRLPLEVQARIADCASRAASALGLRVGPVHAELRVNEAGPWMVEIAGRSIGGYCSRTLRFDMDVTLEELILRQAAGLPLPDVTQAGRAGGVMMIPIPRAGILRRVEGLDAARAVPGIDEIEISAALDNPLLPLPEGASYLGFIFARGDEPAGVEAALRKAHARLYFEIDDYIPVSGTPGQVIMLQSRRR